MMTSIATNTECVVANDMSVDKLTKDSNTLTEKDVVVGIEFSDSARPNPSSLRLYATVAA
jgi:hypothetical protein